MESVIFYKSYYDAIEATLEDPKEKYEIIKILADYAFEAKKPNYDTLSKSQRAIIIMALPLIDSTAKKRAGGKSGGRPVKNNSTGKILALESTEARTPIYIPPDVEKQLQMKSILSTIRSE